jgi:predicted TIM-barrel fold metal-dependent hydrolase
MQPAEERHSMTDPIGAMQVLGHSRRDLLRGGCSAVMLSALGSCTHALGAPPPRWIDVHHHHGTPELIEFLATHESNRLLPPVRWTAAAAIEDMDRSGVQTAVLSQTAPYHLGTPDERRALARSLNEEGARLGIDHPGRFGLFATLPLPSIDHCLAEIENGLDVLGADGVAMLTSADGKWLGDAYFDPIHAELNRRKAVVYVHPWTPDCCTQLVPEIPEFIIEYGTDTSRAIGSLIWSGTVNRYPDIRFIFSHGGGTMPFLIERFLAGTSGELVDGIETRGVSSVAAPPAPAIGTLNALRSFFYDTAQISNPVALEALRKVVSAPQILYGSDYWYRTNEETVAGLVGAGVFSQSELAAVGRGNAERLFGGAPGRALRWPG